MLSKLRQELSCLKAKAKANKYYYDGHVKYHDFELYLILDKQIDRVNNLIKEIEDFTGEPHEWQGNEITLRICDECPIADDCIVYNNWMNRPARKRFDPNGDMIEYDKYGNLKYQVLNLKTGEGI
jgi:hypothetical protein